MKEFNMRFFKTNYKKLQYILGQNVLSIGFLQYLFQTREITKQNFVTGQSRNTKDEDFISC